MRIKCVWLVIGSIGLFAGGSGYGFFTDTFDGSLLNIRWTNDFAGNQGGLTSQPITVNGGVAESADTVTTFYNHIETPIDGSGVFYVQAEVQTHSLNNWGPTLAVYWNPTVYVAIKFSNFGYIQTADGATYNEYSPATEPTIKSLPYTGWKFVRMRIQFLGERIRFGAALEGPNRYCNLVYLKEIPRTASFRQTGALLIVGKGYAGPNAAGPDFDNNSTLSGNPGDAVIIDNVTYQSLQLGTIHGSVSLGGYSSGDYRDVALRVEFIKDGSAVWTDRVLLNWDKTFTVSSIDPDNYTLGIKADCWLRKVLPGVVVNADSTTELVAINLIGGDLDGDDTVDSADLVIVLSNLDLIGE